MEGKGTFRWEIPSEINYKPEISNLTAAANQPAMDRVGTQRLIKQRFVEEKKVVVDRNPHLCDFYTFSWIKVLPIV